MFTLQCKLCRFPLETKEFLGNSSYSGKSGWPTMKFVASQDSEIYFPQKQVAARTVQINMKEMREERKSETC